MEGGGRGLVVANVVVGGSSGGSGSFISCYWLGPSPLGLRQTYRGVVVSILALRNSVLSVKSLFPSEQSLDREMNGH